MNEQDTETGPPTDLSHAGAVVDKAIEYMIEQQIDRLAIASALLGGSLGLLAHTMDDKAIAQILTNALESVRAGEFRHLADPAPRSGPEG